MPVISLSCAVIVRRWRGRQQAILQTLAPELLQEYRRLETLIEEVHAEEARVTQERKAGQTLESKLSKREVAEVSKLISRLPAGTGFFDKAHRIPISVHKQKLIEYLTEHGPATRDDISKAAGIPQGSLSSLLQPPEFERVEHGLWQLKKGKKE